MPLATLMNVAQNIPVLEKLDATDGWSLATIVFLQVVNLWAGDDLFHLLAGLGSGGLVLLTGFRLAIKGLKEYQEYRTLKLKNNRLEHEIEQE